MYRSLPFFVAFVALAAGPAFAGPKCTGTGEKLPETKVQELYKAQGYEIQRWKIASGGCYEIYGRFQGRKVETYIDPWTGNKVQENAG